MKNLKLVRIVCGLLVFSFIGVFACIGESPESPNISGIIKDTQEDIQTLSELDPLGKIVIILEEYPHGPTVPIQIFSIPEIPHEFTDITEINDIQMELETGLIGDIILPKLPIIVEDPAVCGCGSEFNACLIIDLPSVKNQPFCTKECDPTIPSLCETLFGASACCLYIPTTDNPKSAFCFPKEQCCKNCGQLCCPEGFNCINEGEMCLPEFLKPCGSSYCFFDEVCLEGICCPENLSQKCGKKCAPTGCFCIDEEKGICLLEGETNCGEEVICKKGEKCHQGENGFDCLLKDQIPCGKGFCHSKYSVCTSSGCCPKKTPFGCGEKCCYLGEECINEGEACLPIDWEWCNGQMCPPGFKCSPDKKICYPDKGEYCGEVKYCSVGKKCTPTGGCCLQGQKEVGGQCYPGYYECSTGPKGPVCYPPTWKYCFETGNVCEQGESCALKGTTCLSSGWKECPDGHLCPPGLQCAGSTCCEFPTVQNCGNLCCPDYWICKKDKDGKAIACIPSDAQFCIKTGKWCQPPYICASDGECMHYMWTDCGDGLKCSPDKVCSKDGANKKCCLTDQPTLCKDTCCYIGDKCIKDGGLSFCLPIGAEYCGIFNGKPKWCSFGSHCGKKEINKEQCIPEGAEECNNGGYCLSGQTCLNKNEGPKCCLIGDPECLQGAKCEKNSDCVTGGWQTWLSCLPKKLGSAEKYCLKVKQGSFCDDKDEDDDKDCDKLYKGTPCINGICGREYWAECLEENPNDFIDKCRCIFDKECAPGLECMYISSGATCTQISVCGCPDSGKYLSSFCPDWANKGCGIDEYGIYNSAKKTDDAWKGKELGKISVSDAYMTECYFIDSGEGLGWPHGPTGNMHFCLFIPDDEPPQWIANQPPGIIASGFCLPGTEIGHLAGPHPNKCEWFPNMGLLYTNSSLFNWENWKSLPEVQAEYEGCLIFASAFPFLQDKSKCEEMFNRVGIVIWESDTCSQDSWPGGGWYCDIPIFGWIGCGVAEMICDEIREDDIMGAEIIDIKKLTGQCGKKIPLHRYSEGGYRTNTISGWVRIKTKTEE